MPDLIRLYIIQTAIGFAVAAVLVALLLWFNIANLWHLVTHSDAGLLAVVLLWLFNGVVFGGVQFAIAIMRMADDDDDDDDEGGLRAPVWLAEPVPVPVKVHAPRD